MDARLVPPEVVAPADWRRIDFISDLHLADDTPLAFAAWREYLLGTTADAVCILGDLFEAWVGDDSRFAGFEFMATAVLTEAAARRPIFFMIGNRDFLLGADMLAACGIERLADPTVLCAFGERTLLTHGDAWCIADTGYQQFRQEVRSPAWQAQVLSRSLAERRSLARSIRSESERNAGHLIANWADVDAPTALAAMHAAGTPVVVHGHTHRPGSEDIAPGFTRHVLSDWDLDHGNERPRAEVMRWQPGRWTRLGVADAVRPEP